MSPLRRFSFACIILLVGTGSALAQSAAQQRMGNYVAQGERYQKALKFAEAAASYAEAERLAKAIYGPNHDYVITMALAQGTVYEQMGEYPKAIAALQRGLALAEAAGIPDLTAEAINNLAAAYVANGDYKKAVTMHERAYEMFRTQYGDSSPQCASSLMNRAMVLSQLGLDPDAEKMIESAVAVFAANQEDYSPQLARSLRNLANLKMAQGEYARSEKLMLQSLAIMKRILGPEHFEVAQSLNNLGALYKSLGQHGRAEESYLSSLRIMTTSLGPEHLNNARPMLNLAGVFQKQRKFAEAERYYQAALTLRENKLPAGHADIALTWHNLGSFYIDAAQPEKAEAAYLKALTMREATLGAEHPEVGRTLMGLAAVHFINGRHEEARPLHRRAVEIFRKRLPDGHPDRTAIEYMAGWLAAAKKDWREAGAAYERARRTSRTYVDRVLPTLTEAEQLAFLKESDETNLHSALTLPLLQPQDDQLVEYSAGWLLNGKAIVQQTMAQRALMIRDTTNTVTAAMAKHLLELRKKLAGLLFQSGDDDRSTDRQAQLTELSQQEQETSEKLAEQGARSRGTTGWTELADVRRAVKSKSVLVEIARFRRFDFSDPLQHRDKLPERYAAWIVPAAGEGKIEIVDLGDVTPIDAAVKDLRTALKEAPQKILAGGEPDAEKALLEALRAVSVKVLDPLLPALKDRREIYLSPDADLWLVPWAALPLTGGEYAIEKYDLRFVVSGRDLLKNDGRFSAASPALFADPNYDLTPDEVDVSTQEIFPDKKGSSSGLRAAPAGQSSLGIAARLPGTQAEAEAVLPKLAAYTGNQPQLYSDRYALETVFKSLRQPRVVVLSTHGFFRDDGSSTPTEAASQPLNNPLLRCGLLLAGCNKPIDLSVADGEDGILTGLEIVGTDLRGTELVVLSACETGLGDVRNGEGVAGLRQAFQLAGARSVVSTLWQIPDRETARLMTDFFTGLAATGSKSQSLREAQLALIEARRNRYGAAHPFFWAAFTLTGD